MAIEKKTVKEVANDFFEKYQHYYVYDAVSQGEQKVRKPIATIAVGITKGGVPCRGISICSVCENFERGEGRNRAIGRLIEAAQDATCKGVITTSTERQRMGKRVNKAAEAVDHFAALTRNMFIFKAEFGACLSPQEKEILEV